MIAKCLGPGSIGISINNEMCTLVEITQNPNKPTFQMTMRDSFQQPILNYSSLLDVKIFTNKDNRKLIENSVVKKWSYTNKGMVYKSSLQLVTILYILPHGTMMRTFALVGRIEEHHNKNMD